jgi:hypothetical protein
MDSDDSNISDHVGDLDIPACVVQKIRENFPSEEYCGFKYATV